MRTSILVATPHPAFGDLLRSSLQDSRHYQVRLVRSGKEVREAAQQGNFDVAILDSALPDQPFVPLCLNLIEQQKDIQLVVIPPDNNPNHPALSGLMPHGYLHRPFYLPDLLETVAKLLEQREETQPLPVAPRVELPHWLQEPATLRSYLENEIRGTMAQAAIVGACGPAQGAGTLRAYAGQMDETAAQEFSAVVFRYWNRGDKTDLMRFVRLSANKRDYLVYATQITGDLVLILAYENSVPMSQIRPQTKALATSLALLPPKDEIIAAKRKPADLIEEEQREPEQPPAPSTEEIDDNLFFGRIQNSFPSTGQESANLPIVENDLEGVEFINLSSLLGAVPSPDPELPAADKRFQNNGWVRGIDTAFPGAGQLFRDNGTEKSDLPPVIEMPSPMQEARPTAPTLPGQVELQQLDEEAILAETRRMESALANAAAADEILHRDEEDAMMPRAETDVPTQPVPQTEAPVPETTVQPVEKPVEATQKSASSHTESDAPTIPNTTPFAVESSSSAKTASLRPRLEIGLEAEEEEDSELDAARPHLLTTYTNLGQLEPVSPGVSVLNYTCVLVPRLPQHYLTGSLADLLAGWVQQLCVAFGWRLEGLSIRPEYLQWTVQVAPSVSPGNLVKIMRQRTSMHIFNSFVHLREQNPSGDFWAIGYLIVSGSQPPSPQLLRDYIVQTRKRQGISR